MVQGTPLVQGLKFKGSFEELKGDKGRYRFALGEIKAKCGACIIL